MVFREKDDADYHYNVYKENPTQENLDQLIKYRPQDHYDEISKKNALDMIREENKLKNNKEGKKLNQKSKQMKIKIEYLVPNDYNPRKSFRSASLEELKESIKNHGLIEPLVVRSLGNSKYEIVCGMRRYIALKDLDIDEIECIVKDLNDTQALDIAFMENIQRENLSPIEEATALSIRIKSMILSEYGNKAKLIQYQDEVQDKIAHIGALSNKSIYVQKIAELYSLSPTSISRKLSLLILHEDIQNAIENETLPLSIGYEIARLGQLNDTEISKELMLETYKNYFDEKEKLSLQEMKKKVSQKIEYYKKKEEEQETLEKQQIEIIKKKIIEIQKIITTKKENLIEQIEEVRNHEGFKDFEYDYDEENLILFSKNLITLLEQEKEKYQNNDFFEEISYNINELENNLSDIHLLQKRIQEENLSICPYCFAKISLSAIRKKEDIFKEKLTIFKVQKNQISDIAEFIDKKIANIRELILTIENKSRILKKDKKKLMGLNQKSQD